MSDPADPNYAPLLNAHRCKLEVVQSYYIEERYGATSGKDAKTPDFTDADEEDMRLYRIAQSYERGIERALKESGLDVALSAYRNAQARLRSIIWDLCAIRAKTTEGVAIKVRATAAYSTFGTEEKLQASLLLSQAIWSDLGEEA